MEIKSVPTKDVIKYKKDIDYHRVQRQNQKLDTSLPFAVYNTSLNKHIWSNEQEGWHPKSEASEIKQQDVAVAMVEYRQKLSGRLSENIIQLLFTYPDDTYVFYRDGSDGVEFLITGWGFKYPERAISGGEKIQEKIILKNPVSIAFVYDGQYMADYPFAIGSGSRVVKERTDDTGLYHFNDLGVGESFIFYDLNTDQKFPLQIESGKQLYEFDITQYFLQPFKAMMSDNPLEGETIDITYNGKTYQVTTDVNGEASLSLPYYENQPIMAKLNDMEKEGIATRDGQLILFLIEEPEQLSPVDDIPEPPIIEEEPPKEEKTLPVLLETVVLLDGIPKSGIPVTITYGGIEYKGDTDDKGEYNQVINPIEGEIAQSAIPNLPSIALKPQYEEYYSEIYSAVARFTFNLTVEKPTFSNKTPWWQILLMIIVVLLLALLMWSLFTRFLPDMTEFVSSILKGTRL